MSVKDQSKKKFSIKVEEYSSPSLVVVTPDRPITEVAELMVKNQFRHVPVVESGEPIGILSDRDIKVIANFEHQECLRAKDLMSPGPYIVESSDYLEDVALAMSKYKIGSAIVRYSEDGSFGIFTSTDALNALVELLRGETEL